MFAVRDHLSHTALVPAVLCAILPALGLVLLNICTYSKKLGEKCREKVPTLDSLLRAQHLSRSFALDLCVLQHFSASNKLHFKLLLLQSLAKSKNWVCSLKS